MCFARMLVHVCVVLCVSWSSGCRSHWNGCMNVAWAMLWGGSRSTKPCVFPCKVAGGDDERYLVCAAVAAAVVPDAIGSSYVFCKNACSCVRSSMRFLKLWLQIALEWLHECCMNVVVAASRLLGAAAACVILLSFAAEHRKSYWSGCIQGAKVICQQIFSILALIIFLLKFLLKSASKSSFCRFGVEIRFWSCNFRHLACSSIVFCNSVSADRIVVAARQGCLVQRLHA